MADLTSDFPFGSTVGAVVVTYHPHELTLERIFQAIIDQIDHLFVIDNGSSASVLSYLYRQAEAHETCRIVSLQRNEGVARAHNIGLEWGLQAGCSHVLLLDQDSIPADNMVRELLQAYHRMKRSTDRISALGPRFINRDYTNASYFVRFGRLGIKRVFCSSGRGEEIIPADFLISSGALVSMKAYAAIGGMDESLFIDHVDTDWFLRARARGWQAYGVCTAHMEHKLGEKTLRLRMFRWTRYVAQYDPWRYYYIFRNTLLLLKRSYLPGMMELPFFFRLLGIAVLYTIYGSSRGRFFIQAVKGIKDGVLGRTSYKL